MARTEIARLHDRARADLAGFWQTCLETGPIETHSLETFARLFEALADAARWLKDLPEDADEATVRATIERSAHRLNTVNAACAFPIMTDEREILVAFLCEAASARGLDLDRFEHRDPTLPFRDW